MNSTPPTPFQSHSGGKTPHTQKSKLMTTEGPSSSSSCNLAILDSLTDDSIRQIHDSYTGFCATTATLLTGAGDLSVGPEFIAHVHSLCHHGLHSLVRDHFLKSLEVYIHMYLSMQDCYNALNFQS